MRHFTRDYFTVTEAAQVMSKKEKKVCQLCRAGKFPGATKKGKQGEIPIADIYKYVNPKEAADADAEVRHLIIRYGEGPVLSAQQKLGWVNKYYKLFNQFYTGKVNRKDAEILAIEQIKLDISRECETVKGFSRTTLFRWKQKCRKYGLAGLIDKRILKAKPLPRPNTIKVFNNQ